MQGIHRYRIRYNVGHRHPKVLKAVRDQWKNKQFIAELIDPLRTHLAHLM